MVWNTPETCSRGKLSILTRTDSRLRRLPSDLALCICSSGMFSRRVESNAPAHRSQVNYLIADGKSHWLEGVLLMMMYLIIALAAWYVPPRITRRIYRMPADTRQVLLIDSESRARVTGIYLDCFFCLTFRILHSPSLYNIFSIPLLPYPKTRNTRHTLKPPNHPLGRKVISHSKRTEHHPRPDPIIPETPAPASSQAPLPTVNGSQGPA